MDASSQAEHTNFRWTDTMLAILGGLLGSAVIGGILLVVIYGTDLESVDTAAQFWVLLPAQIICQFWVILFISRRRGTASLEKDFGLVVEPKDVKWMVAGPVALFALSFVALGLRSMLGAPDENPQALLDSVSEYSRSITALAIVLGVVVLGPLVEEVTFRGLLLQTALNKGLSARTAVLISAVVFSLVHLVDWSLASLTGAVTLIVLFLLGVFLAELRIRTGSLAAPLFTHSAFNLTTILILFFFPEA